MWWNKKKEIPDIIFECNNWAIRKYAPIQPAYKFVPNKFKNLPTVIKKGEKPIDDIYSIKICPGLQNYMALGYVIPAWCDIEIKPNGKTGTPEIRYSDPENNLACHYPEQLGDFLDDKFDVKIPIKLDNPWKPWQPKGWSALYLPMYYFEDHNFEAIPGVIDGDMASLNSPINIMVKQDKPFIIKMGTPLTQVIPFERKPGNCVTREPSDQGIYRFEAIRKSKFMTFKGWRDKVVSKHKDNFVVDAQNTDLPEN